MKIYIISSKENVSLATKLLRKVSNANIVLGISSMEAHLHSREFTKKSLSEADVILTVTDSENSYTFKDELQIALAVSKKQKKYSYQ
ncbi:MAG: hypothetical protein J6M03_08445 [Clostridia bacterium]|nr:hypothetical protein [Clostridia bacterium]